MSTPNYSTWSDTDLLVAGTEALQGAYTDTSGTDDDRWRAVLNTALDDLLRGDLGIELLKRKRKWGDPIPNPQPGQLPPTTPIANPDRLAIVSGSSPNWTYVNA